MKHRLDAVPALFVRAHVSPVGARGATVHVRADQNLVPCEPEQKALLLDQGPHLDIDRFVWFSRSFGLTITERGFRSSPG